MHLRKRHVASRQLGAVATVLLALGLLLVGKEATAASPPRGEPIILKSKAGATPNVAQIEWKFPNWPGASVDQFGIVIERCSGAVKSEEIQVTPDDPSTPAVPRFETSESPREHCIYYHRHAIGYHDVPAYARAVCRMSTFAAPFATADMMELLAAQDDTTGAGQALGSAPIVTVTSAVTTAAVATGVPKTTAMGERAVDEEEEEAVDDGDEEEVPKRDGAWVGAALASAISPVAGVQATLGRRHPDQSNVRRRLLGFGPPKIGIPKAPKFKNPFGKKPTEKPWPVGQDGRCDTDALTQCKFSSRKDGIFGVVCKGRRCEYKDCCNQCETKDKKKKECKGYTTAEMGKLPGRCDQPKSDCVYSDEKADVLDVRCMSGSKGRECTYKDCCEKCEYRDRAKDQCKGYHEDKPPTDGRCVVGDCAYSEPLPSFRGVRCKGRKCKYRDCCERCSASMKSKPECRDYVEAAPPKPPGGGSCNSVGCNFSERKPNFASVQCRKRTCTYRDCCEKCDIMEKDQPECKGYTTGSLPRATHPAVLALYPTFVVEDAFDTVPPQRSYAHSAVATADVCAMEGVHLAWVPPLVDGDLAQPVCGDGTAGGRCMFQVWWASAAAFDAHNINPFAMCGVKNTGVFAPVGAPLSGLSFTLLGVGAAGHPALKGKKATPPFDKPVPPGQTSDERLRALLGDRYRPGSGGAFIAVTAWGEKAPDDDALVLMSSPANRGGCLLGGAARAVADDPSPEQAAGDGSGGGGMMPIIIGIVVALLLAMAGLVYMVRQRRRAENDQYAHPLRRGGGDGRKGGRAVPLDEWSSAPHVGRDMKSSHSHVRDGMDRAMASFSASVSASGTGSSSYAPPQHVAERLPPEARHERRMADQSYTSTYSVSSSHHSSMSGRSGRGHKSKSGRKKEPRR